jgi:hypothetical protein
LKKIPTLFVRDEKNRKLVTREVNPECAWVVAGEGIATVKFDGTCCLVHKGALYKRRELKPGQETPEGFIPAAFDAITGKGFGWVPVGDGPEDEWHREAWAEALTWDEYPEDATFELVGPKVQGNPYGLSSHSLFDHGVIQYPMLTDPPPTDFDALRDYLAADTNEGYVWHHDDGRMAKIKRRDFGLPWPVPALTNPTTTTATNGETAE